MKMKMRIWGLGGKKSDFKLTYHSLAQHASLWILFIFAFYVGLIGFLFLSVFSGGVGFWVLGAVYTKNFKNYFFESISSH